MCDGFSPLNGKAANGNTTFSTIPSSWVGTGIQSQPVLPSPSFTMKAPSPARKRPQFDIAPDDFSATSRGD
jgi:hypothetical protein